MEGKLFNRSEQGISSTRHRKWQGCTQYIQTNVKKKIKMEKKIIFTTHYLRTFMRVLPFCHSEFRLSSFFLFHCFFFFIEFLSPVFIFQDDGNKNIEGKNIYEKKIQIVGIREGGQNPVRVQILFFLLVLFRNIFGVFFVAGTENFVRIYDKDEK